MDEAQRELWQRLASALAVIRAAIGSKMKESSRSNQRHYSKSKNKCFFLATPYLDRRQENLCERLSEGPERYLQCTVRLGNFHREHMNSRRNKKRIYSKLHRRGVFFKSTGGFDHAAVEKVIRQMHALPISDVREYNKLLYDDNGMPH